MLSVLLGGIQLFASMAKNAFELTKTFDGLGFALERVAGDSLVAADSHKVSNDINTRFWC